MGTAVVMLIVDVAFQEENPILHYSLQRPIHHHDETSVASLE
jgi:hypothetical protein